MSLTQSQIDAIPVEGLIAVAAYKLEWVEGPSGTSLELFAASCAAITPSQTLEELLRPFLDPEHRTRPYTVYAGTAESESALVSAAQTNAGLAEEEYETTEEALRACLGVWFG